VSGYVEAGYLVGFGTLATYAVTLVARERAGRRRLEHLESTPRDDPAGDSPVTYAP